MTTGPISITVRARRRCTTTSAVPSTSNKSYRDAGTTNDRQASQYEAAGDGRCLKTQEQDPGVRELSFVERLSLLVDQLWNWRENQEAQKPLETMARLTPPDHGFLPARPVRQQRCGSIPRVVMRLSLGQARAQGQRGLLAVERLYLTLLVLDARRQFGRGRRETERFHGLRSILQNRRPRRQSC